MTVTCSNARQNPAYRLAYSLFSRFFLHTQTFRTKKSAPLLEVRRRDELWIPLNNSRPDTTNLISFHNPQNGRYVPIKFYDFLHIFPCFYSIQSHTANSLHCTFIYIVILLILMAIAFLNKSEISHCLIKKILKNRLQSDFFLTIVVKRGFLCWIVENFHQ